MARTYVTKKKAFFFSENLRVCQSPGGIPTSLPMMAKERYASMLFRYIERGTIKEFVRADYDNSAIWWGHASSKDEAPSGVWWEPAFATTIDSLHGRSLHVSAVTTLLLLHISAVTALLLLHVSAVLIHRRYAG